MRPPLLIRFLAAAGFLAMALRDPCDPFSRLLKAVFETAAMAAVAVEETCYIVVYHLGVVDAQEHLCLPLGLAASTVAGSATWPLFKERIDRQVPKHCDCI